MICVCLSHGMMAQSVTPQFSNNLYSFQVADVYLEIDPSTAARISAVTLDKKELLYIDKSNGNDNWGATFWPSPQAYWNWPPPAPLNNNAYQASISGNTLTLRSQVDNTTGFRFTKKITASVSDTSITIQYGIINTLTKVISVAPWEITRFPGGGITFFPQRVSGQSLTGDLATLTQDVSGITWFNYDSTKISSNSNDVPKLYSDGTEGWLAHVLRDGSLVVKKFTDTPVAQKAPDPENEIEMYTNPNKSYQEVEEQGPYTALQPNDSLAWTVKWFVRKVPANVPLTVGNAALASYVRKIVGGIPTGTLDALNNSEMFIIFPNPAKDNITIVPSDKSITLDNVLLWNSAGIAVPVHSGRSGNGASQLDLTGLKSGLYFLQLIYGGNVQEKTFVIE
jgi:hypothetical protein